MVVVAIGLGLFFDVYEIFLSSTIAIALKTEYGLSGTPLQLLLASSFLGMFVGAALFGRLADRIGRRKAFLLNLLWFSGWSVVAAFAPNATFLVVARFMAGIGVGAEYPVADAYLSDVLPKAHRGRLAAWAYTCSFIAVPALGFASLGLAERHLFGIDGWRILCVVGAVGALFVIVLRRGLPESPRWLAGVGRTEEAEAALKVLGDAPTAASAPMSVPPEPVPAEPVPAEPVPPGPDPAVGALNRLRLPPYRRRLGMLCAFQLFQPFGYYGFGTLAALVLVSRGFDVTHSLLYTAVSFLGYPIGSMLSIPLLKKIERKFLVMGSIGAMAVTGLVFATSTAPAMVVVFGFLTTALSNVFSNAAHIYQAEIFPSDVRGTAVGMTYSLSRLSAAALPFILIPVLDAHGAAAMFSVVIAAIVVTVAVVAVFGPRTTGRNLEEINPV